MLLSRSLLRIQPRPRELAGVEGTAADAVILDLDSVSDGPAAEAYQEIRERCPARLLASSRVQVQLSSIHDPACRADLDLALELGVRVLHLPRVTTADEVRALDRLLLDASTRWGIGLDEIHVCLGIASSRAVLDAEPLCSASTHVSGLLIDGDSLCDEWGSERSPEGHELDHVRQSLVLVGSTHGVVVLDAAFPFPDPALGLEREARRARSFGFKGKLAASEAHCPTLNAVFRVSPREVERAGRIVAAADIARAEEQGTSLASELRRVQVGERMARRTLRWAESQS